MASGNLVLHHKSYVVCFRWTDVSCIFVSFLNKLEKQCSSVLPFEAAMFRATKQETKNRRRVASKRDTFFGLFLRFNFGDAVLTLACPLPTFLCQRFVTLTTTL